MDFSIILTSYKEPFTIGKALENIIRPNLDIISHMQLIVVAPDKETLDAANQKLREFPDLKNQLVLQDEGKGKPAAINLAEQKSDHKILLLTDGDMYISKNSIKDILRYFENPKVGGVSGRPISMDNRETQFGYYSHLFCEAAHQQRLFAEYVPMSGYLYAIRNLKSLFPIPEEIRAEDAYLSAKLKEAGYEIKYEPKALAHVHFPKNLNDWIKQKRRSLGGNVQSAKFSKESRNIGQDFKNAMFPLQFAESPKELWYSLLLYPLRLYLWILIYFQHSTNKYSKGQWERIESSKH